MIIGNGKIKYCDNELLKELMRDIPDNYSIGLHNIGIFPKVPIILQNNLKK